MTFAELQAECTRVRAQGLTFMCCVMPSKRRRSNRIRVLPGVMGRVVGSQVSGTVIVSVEIAAVERYLDWVNWGAEA